MKISEILSHKPVTKYPKAFFDRKAEIISVKELEKNGKKMIKITVKGSDFPVYGSALYTVKGGTEKQMAFCLRKLAEIVIHLGLKEGDLEELVGKKIPAVLHADGEYWNAIILPSDKEELKATEIYEKWADVQMASKPEDVPF